MELDMALHIQMSDDAIAILKKNALRNNLSSIAACLALILLGGSVLFFSLIYIDIATEAQFTPYTAPADNAAPTKRPQVKEMTMQSSTASVAPSVIVSSGPSLVTMAEVEIDTPDIPVGLGLDLSPVAGAGLGDGLGSTIGGIGSAKGGGSSLEGTFYDFKLVRNGRATTTVDKNKFKVISILSEFFKKNWSPRVLQKYYSAPTKLYASNFIIPACQAEFAPVAYKATKSKPSALAAIYRGKVRAPITGNFRFVGIGDDIIAVRFANKMVLEYGWAIPTQYKKGSNLATMGVLGINKDFIKKVVSGGSFDHKGYKICKVANIGHWGSVFGGLMGGTPFKVIAGKEYPIEILISEIPGGSFGGILLIENMDNPLIVNGVEIYDIFRTNFTLPDAAALTKELRKGKYIAPDKKVTLPVFNKESLIWIAVP